MKALLLLGAVLIGLHPQQHLPAHQWNTYTNARFQYSICYPEDLLNPKPEATNGDGRRFTGKDGVRLIVFGRNNVLNESLKEMMEESASTLAANDGKITYGALKPNWFAISGVNENHIFYSKTFLSHDQFKSFEITYPESAAAVWNPLISRISSCFSDLAR